MYLWLRLTNLFTSFRATFNSSNSRIRFSLNLIPWRGLFLTASTITNDADSKFLPKILCCDTNTRTVSRASRGCLKWNIESWMREQLGIEIHQSESHISSIKHNFVCGCCGRVSSWESHRSVRRFVKHKIIFFRLHPSLIPSTLAHGIVGVSWKHFRLLHFSFTRVDFSIFVIEFNGGISRKLLWRERKQ